MSGTSVHRITTKNHYKIIGLIYSKAMIFDLDVENKNENWQEPFLKSTHENKHDGISQL